VHLVGFYYENKMFESAKSGISFESRILKCILDCSYSYKDEQNLEWLGGLYTRAFVIMAPCKRCLGAESYRR
jgi:hypothetical protein